MATQPDYIPSRISELTAWATNFDAVIVGTPFTLPGTLGADLTAATTAMNSAIATATDPGSRTPVNIQVQNSAIAAWKTLARQAAQYLQVLPSMTNGDRAILGITVPGAGGSPSNIPATAPAFEVRVSGPGQIRAQVQNVEAPDSRAIAPGATAIEVWAAVSPDDNPITDPASASLLTTITRPISNLTAPSGSAGKLVSYFARYIAPNATTGTKIGPFSVPASLWGQ